MPGKSEDDGSRLRLLKKARSRQGREHPSGAFRPASFQIPVYKLISPFHIASLIPSFSTKFCHRGPPLSFRRRYDSNFCLLCTSTLKFLLLCLSFLCRLSARALIFVVRMAACTSEDPVSGPIRRGATAVFGSAAFIVRIALLAGLGGSTRSVLCRPNSSMHRWILTRVRSLLLPLSKAVIAASAL